MVLRAVEKNKADEERSAWEGEGKQYFVWSGHKSPL